MGNQNIKLNLIKVSQNSNVFYISKIKANELMKIATLHWRNSGDSQENKYVNEVKNKLNVKESSNGIQRVIQQKRLKEIAEYLDSEKGILPNSIIVALNNKWHDEDIIEEEGYKIVEISEDFLTLEIDPDKVDAFIVDGQHRLASFGYTDGNLINDFELVVSIFLNLEIPIQAEIFSIINGKQKPVNKSLLYDLSSFNENEYDEIKRCHSIVKWLDNHEISPFFNKIKMLGTGVGSISQSAFIDELVKYIKVRKKKEYKSFMRSFDEKEIIKILLSYFTAIQEYFGKDNWEDVDQYVFLKTTGFGALMKLLYYVYVKHMVEKKPFLKNEIKDTLIGLDLEFFSSARIGKGGSQGQQTQLFNELLNVIYLGEKKRNSFDYEIEYEFEILPPQNSN